jgi:hypothetical protein
MALDSISSNDLGLFGSVADPVECQVCVLLCTLRRGKCELAWAFFELVLKKTHVGQNTRFHCSNNEHVKILF